jgi:hypothetical protein
MSNAHVHPHFRGILDAVFKRDRVIVSHEFPPIPDRSFDYRAMHDGDDEAPWKHGWGATEAEARADLARLDQEHAESLEEEEWQ